MFPKPQKRIKDPKALQQARKPYCEMCYKWGNTEPHHIVFRSQGGHDTTDNLISLCIECHNDAHGKGKSKTTTPKEVLYQAKEGWRQ
jgi:5-methylcytosine-specific restriction endonuclease McrA